MEQRPPVEDWTSDYDIFDPASVQDPTPIRRNLREREVTGPVTFDGVTFERTRNRHIAFPV